MMMLGPPDRLWSCDRDRRGTQAGLRPDVPAQVLISIAVAESPHRISPFAHPRSPARAFGASTIGCDVPRQNASPASDFASSHELATARANDDTKILNPSRGRGTTLIILRERFYDCCRYRRLGFIGSGAGGYAEHKEKAVGLSACICLRRYQGSLAIA